MGWMTRIGNFVTSKRFSLLDYTGYAAGVPAYSARDFETLAKEGYLENSIAFACIDALSNAIGGIPWKVMKKVGTKWEPYDTHPLIDLLNNPNPAQSGSEFAEAEVTYFLIGGTSYMVLVGSPVDIEKPLNSPPVRLLLPRPDFVRPVPDQMGIPTSYVIGMSNDNKRYDASRVVQMRRFNPLDPIFGLSALKVAGKDVDVLNSITNFIYRLMRRNGRPDGVIITEGALKGDQYDRLQKQVDDKFNNSNSAGGWKLFEGIVKEIKEFAFKPADMNLDPTELARIRAICAVFKVPPEIIGVTQAKTYSNYAEARRALYIEGVLPLLDKIRDKRNQRLMPFYSKTDRLDYDKDEIEALQRNQDQKSTTARADFQAGIITANEARSIGGYEPADDILADERMVSMSVVPASDYSNQDATTADTGNEGEGGTPEETDPKDITEKQNKAMVGRAHQEIGMVRRSEEPLEMRRGLNAGVAWRRFDDGRVAYLRSVRNLAQKEVMADYAAAAANISKTGAVTESSALTAVREAVDNRRGAWEATYRKIYMSVGLGFAERVDKGLEKSFGGERKRRFVKRAASDTWSHKIGEALKRTGGAKIASVQSTTRKRIMRVVSESYAAGLGADATAAAIVESSKLVSPTRALTIARTEVIAASNLGSDVAARSFGLPLNKSWLATEDGRERDTHGAADGQTVALDDTFEVGGESLAYPGDSSTASAEETINCRCAVTYELAE